MTDVPCDQKFWKDALERVSRQTRSVDEAEDLLHSAFLRLARYAKHHTVDNPVGFLVRAAANIRIDNYRREKTLGDCISDSALQMQGGGSLQDEVIVSRARLERVGSGLDQLPARTREVFLLHRLDGLRYREIAVRLGISQSSVEKHIAKAVAFLAEWTQGW